MRCGVVASMRGGLLAAVAFGLGVTSGLAQGVSGASEAAPALERASAQPAPPLATDIHEAIERVTVDLTLPSGKPWRGDMAVTHYRPDGNGPFPLVVINHGRLTAQRHDPARWRSLALARFWVRRGFAVLVPTRVGYGELGQEVDPEASGACSRADFRPAMAAMATQIEAAVRFGAGLPWADGNRVLLSGVSYGGFGTIAAAARNIPGVVGAINYVGGLGGNPQARPGEPCQGEAITRIAADAGEQTRIPMLWLYAENDRYWGAAWPRRWHAAYTEAGGKARLEMFPAVSDDGHKLMSEGFMQWRPKVDAFIASIGFEPPRAGLRLARSRHAALEEIDKVPFVKDAVRTDAYVRFLSADVPRAFAISASGAWAWRSGEGAVEIALRRCQIHSREPCSLYAVDDHVVWDGATK